MHGLLHKLAMGVVLLHTLGGCCVHHAHAAAPECCQDKGHDHTADHDACHGGGESCCPNDKDAPHSGECDESQCVFVVPETGGAARLVGPLCTDAVVSVPAVAVSAESPAPSWFRPLSCCRRPPTRLHLIFQVLLI